MTGILTNGLLPSCCKSLNEKWSWKRKTLSGTNGAGSGDGAGLSCVGACARAPVAKRTTIAISVLMQSARIAREHPSSVGQDYTRSIHYVFTTDGAKTLD